MKIKIGEKEFVLNNWYRSNTDGRPSVVFDIQDTYSNVYEAAKNSTSFILDLESQSGVSETLDVSDECKFFEECVNKKDERCVLTMSKMSELEEAIQDVDDLTLVVEALSGNIN